MDARLKKIIAGLEESYKDYFEPFVTKVGKENYPYKVLISTLISLRTKDAVTAIAAEKLFLLADSPQKMIKLSAEQIKKAIYPAGFYKRKAQTIIDASKTLIEKYDGQVPDDLDKLLEIKGVGRKTANLVVSEGFNMPGLCVDTHVHRISNRLGLVKTKNAFGTEIALKGLLPLEYWKPFNMWLVAHGQNTCNPVSPKCSLCKISGECMKVSVIKSR